VVHALSKHAFLIGDVGMSEDLIEAGRVELKASLATCPDDSVESILRHVGVGVFLSIENGERNFPRHQREIPVCADQTDLSASIFLAQW
jgi:hypothetical protein